LLLYFISSSSYSAFGLMELILGSPALAGENLFEIKGLGAIFALLNALLWALVRLFAGLSFAAVCFDESKNIWFRVVAVAALMLIIFGGLNIM
jgi:uncharacterized membrane protein